jgi:methionyl-tRNA formyltransferase
MNLVLIAASTLGLRCLETCLQIPDVEVVGAVTAPQTFAISYRPSGVTNILHADIPTLAKAHNVPVQTLERSMNEPGLFETVAAWRPDAFLVAGWYHMIPKRWRELAPAYGLHASLLPDYSGGAPLVWAMINGETRTGITLFQMDDGVDSGPIAGQQEEVICADDTIAKLYARIEQRGLELLRETLPQLAKGTLKLHPQDETKRRVVPQRGPEDGLIDWNRDGASIDRFIRAQTRPYPGAFSSLEERPLHIWRASVLHPANNSGEPGRVQHLGTGLYAVCCGTGAIQLNEISYEQRTYSQTRLTRLFAGGGSSWAHRRTA